jgi:hypothetical protein
MFGSCIVGIANYAIYMATIDYMICAYGPYSASATGGNGWSRDFLAGILTVPATPFYSNIGASKGKNLQYASTILFCISFVLVIAVYVIYWKGPILRKRSPFAQSLHKNAGKGGRITRVKSVKQAPNQEGAATPGSTNPVVRPERPGFGSNSRHSSWYASQNAASRTASRNASRENSFEGTRGVTRPYVHNTPPVRGGLAPIESNMPEE